MKKIKLSNALLISILFGVFLWVLILNIYMGFVIFSDFINEDIINSFFEFSMFIASIVNIAKICRDKIIRGVHWATVVIASLWGFWNLHYYSSLDQWWSFFAGILLVISNSTWLILVFYYAKREVKS